MWPINQNPVILFSSSESSLIQSMLTLGTTDWAEVACHHGDSSFCGMPSLCILGGLGRTPPTFPCKPLNTPILRLRTLFQTNRLPLFFFFFFLYTDTYHLWLWVLWAIKFKKKNHSKLGKVAHHKFYTRCQAVISPSGNNVKCWVICTNRYEISHSAKVPLPPLLLHGVCSASALIHSDS